MITYCKKCLIPEKDFKQCYHEESDEVYEVCSNCFSSLDIVTTETMPTKKEPKILLVKSKGKVFDLAKWEKERIEFETESDRKINEYIKDFCNKGKEAAEHNYFNQKTI